ncbi:PLP-dependent transferase [Hymenopellis radicata]|nr:PLP-dependent transferase [Hymenopellis radicata]
MTDSPKTLPNGNGIARSVKALPNAFYDDFLSDDAKSRKPSPIRSLLPLEATPGVLSLLAGKPNPTTFPFTSLSFTVRSPVEPGREVPYGETGGIPALRKWIDELQARVHGRRQGEGWRTTIGSGSQDLICKAVTALVNRGDPILVESPVYAGVIPMFQSLECDQIEVETDSHGIMSSSLRSILENWPKDKIKPRVLYTVPYGCNPTGMTATLERRKEVLKLAHEYNFLILEDDPYYFLYYGTGPRYPSYFTLELEEAEVGRVIRFDSLSKVLSAGIRIGYASGPDVIILAMDRHTSTANLQTASLTQVIISSLLRSWGYDQFLAHTEYVADFYRRKRDTFEQAMHRHLTGLAEWVSPEAGMFFWFKLLVGPPGEEDSESVIRSRAFEKGVIALPGMAFHPNGRKTGYVRASFSTVEDVDIDEAVKRLRDAILDARAGDILSE